MWGGCIALLEELKIAHNTLVIFTSDNGPHSEGGHKHEYFDANGPLRGYKRDLYDGGIRAPTIAWWPGKIKPGSVSDEPLAAYDWLPTACELAGVEAPKAPTGCPMCRRCSASRKPATSISSGAMGRRKRCAKGTGKP